MSVNTAYNIVLYIFFAKNFNKNKFRMAWFINIGTNTFY